MKKAGIMTFCYEHNYGAVLQSLALSKILESKNIDVEVIRYVTDSAINNHLKLLDVKRENIVKQIITAPFNYNKFNNFKKFINKNINITKPLYNTEEFKKYTEEFDALVCGSDQVWNSDITGKEFEVFFMGKYKGQKTKLYSYAASFGKDEVSKQTVDALKKEMKKYQIIGVREQSGQKILKDKANVESTVVLDPTLLFDKEQWSEYATPYDIKEDYMLVYTMEKNDLITKIANEISKEKNLKIVHFRKEKIFNNEIKRAINAGPGEFLTLFKNAKYVVTNSFHGLAFSLINNKEFVSIAHKERNTRQESLLNILGLNNRIIQSYEAYKSIENKKIDYKKVNEVLEKEREKSLDFIERIVDDINE